MVGDMVYSYPSSKFGVNSLEDLPRKPIFTNDGQTDNDGRLRHGNSSVDTGI